MQNLFFFLLTFSSDILLVHIKISVTNDSNMYINVTTFILINSFVTFFYTESSTPSAVFFFNIYILISVLQKRKKKLFLIIILSLYENLFFFLSSSNTLYTQRENYK